MRRPWLVRFVILFVMLLIPLCAGSQSPTAQPASNPINLLAWMVGGTWVTQEKNGDSVLTVELRCRWAENHQAIVWDVRFRNGEGTWVPQYQGMYVWHPGKNSLVLWQVDRSGQVAEGELHMDGKRLTQFAHVTHPDGKSHELQSFWELKDENTFHFKAYFRPNSSDPWKDALDLDYRRIAGN